MSESEESDVYGGADGRYDFRFEIARRTQQMNSNFQRSDNIPVQRSESKQYHSKIIENMSKLELVREAVVREMKSEHEVDLEPVELHVVNWEGQYPDLRKMLSREQVDWLLKEMVRFAEREIDPRPYVEFVVRSGYKDELRFDEEGEPQLRRTTALHLASSYSCGCDVVECLFEIYDRYDANYIADEDGSTHFHIACKYGLYDIVQKFLEHVDPDCLVEKTGDTPLHLSLTHGKADVVRSLLSKGADRNLANAEGRTPLHALCTKPDGGPGDDNLAETFFAVNDADRRTVDIDARDKAGQTALHLAADHGKSELFERLLRRGADSTLANDEGDTPLHLVCQRNAVHLAELLFTSTNERNQAVLLDAQNNKGNTPLHVALSHSTGRRMAELLLGKGADSTLVNKGGETLLHVVCMAAQDGEMAEMLFRICDERGEQVALDARDNWGNTPLHNLTYAGYNANSTCELLLARGADPNVTDNRGRTPLHMTCVGYDIELARTLLNHQRVRVDLPDREGNTALHLALEYEQMEAAELLLRNGADPNLARTADGYRPLHIICKGEQDGDVVQMFFRICDERHLQVEVDTGDNLGNTPLQLAVANFLPDKVDLLLSRGADLSNFVFPADFGAGMDAGVDYYFTEKLKMASDSLAVVEILETRGYDTDRSEALRVMKLFARLGLFVESAEELENFWRDDEHFANDAIEQMVKPGLTLYELIRAGPKEAAKLVTLKEFSEFARTVRWHGIRRHLTCAEHLREKMSRAFFRIWALGSMMELIHYRLPLECCEMIIDNWRMDNKDMCNICLAAAGETVEYGNSNSDNNSDNYSDNSSDSDYYRHYR